MMQPGWSWRARAPPMPVARGDDAIPVGGQPVDDDLQQVGLVVDDEDQTGRRSESAGGGGRPGEAVTRRPTAPAVQQTTNAAPPCGVLTQIRPPWSSDQVPRGAVMAAAQARCRAAAPTRPARPGRTCRPRRARGRDPGPEVLDREAARAPLACPARAVIGDAARPAWAETRPRSPRSRFVRTWRSRSGSAQNGLGIAASGSGDHARTLRRRPRGGGGRRRPSRRPADRRPATPAGSARSCRLRCS